ncbi:hypothetical protein RB653_002052 [Dictyostelium firmibasis]|uniref:Cell surface glycoprotein n=1 Tax=Dictyostelium firmibasis TaxID=79012 RepID=A0AAN7YMP4_9MYCE
MKIIILTIFFIYLFNFGQCITDPDQKLVMSDVLKQLYNVDSSIDPCTLQFTYCKTDNITNYQVILNVHLYFAPNNAQTLNQDFTKLLNLTFIRVVENIAFNSSFYDNLYKLTKLEYFDIHDLSVPISENVTLPDSLETVKFDKISVPLGQGWFKSIAQMQIFSASAGFSLPKELSNVNPLLQTLGLSVISNSSIPTNIPQSLPNLQQLVLNIYNDMDQDDYQNITISSKGVYKKLTDLEIYFYNDVNAQPILLDQILSNTPVLEYLNIDGLGYAINPLVGFLDLSYIKGKRDFFMDLGKFSNSFCQQCNGSCFKLPEYSGIYSYEWSYPFSCIDLRNLSSLEVYQNGYEQFLPNIDNALYIQLIIIQESIVVGDIPESYCKVELNLSDNQLDGTVPSCILCIGYLEASWVLPNPFSNFNSSSIPYCPGFLLDQNYTNLVATDGGYINITGKNLGWGNYNDYFTIIPNEKLAVRIGVGFGKNLQKTITLQNNQKVTLNFSYIPPTIKSYSIFELMNSKFFVLNGTGFNFKGENNVTINGIPITFSNSGGGSNSDNIIGFNFTQFPSLAIETQFTVSIDVGGQVSNQVTFYYFPSITITEKSLVLNSTGGSINITGSFITNNSSLISVSINGTKCSLISYTNSLFTISYPQFEVGDDYVLTLVVGGYAINLPVTYVQGPTPSPTQTSTSTPTPTPSPTSTSTPTPTPTKSQTPTSEPNDDGSLASNLSIPSCLLIILLITQQLI